MISFSCFVVKQSCCSWKHCSLDWNRLPIGCFFLFFLFVVVAVAGVGLVTDCVVCREHAGDSHPRLWPWDSHDSHRQHGAGQARDSQKPQGSSDNSKLPAARKLGMCLLPSTLQCCAFADEGRCGWGGVILAFLMGSRDVHLSLSLHQLSSHTHVHTLLYTVSKDSRMSFNIRVLWRGNVILAFLMGSRDVHLSLSTNCLHTRTHTHCCAQFLRTARCHSTSGFYSGIFLVKSSNIQMSFSSRPHHPPPPLFRSHSLWYNRHGWIHSL